jgi:hypothetical protein
VNFSLDLITDFDILDSLDEGVEFGYRLNDNEWIPLAWYTYSLPNVNNRDNQIEAGELMDNNLIIRGFSIPFYHEVTHNVQLKLCGSEIMEDGASLNFRWLQTASSNLQPSVDDIAIDDVQIGINSSTLQLMLLMDDFDNQMSIK